MISIGLGRIECLFVDYSHGEYTFSLRCVAFKAEPYFRITVDFNILRRTDNEKSGLKVG
jgi:hypothetical protein